MPYVDRTVFTTNDQSSGEVADPNKLEANDSHLADVVDANYTELNDLINGNAFSKLGAVNVKDFGAVGDGVTDDTEAIQDAIDEAGAKGVVYFPKTKEGYTYLVSSTINIPYNEITLTSLGKAEYGPVIKGTTDSMTILNVSGYGFKMLQVQLEGDADLTSSTYTKGTIKGILFDRSGDPNIDAEIFGCGFFKLHTGAEVIGRNSFWHYNLFSICQYGTIVNGVTNEETRGHRWTSNRYHSIGGNDLGTYADESWGVLINDTNAFGLQITENLIDFCKSFYKGPSTESNISDNQMYYMNGEAGIYITSSVERLTGYSIQNNIINGIKNLGGDPDSIAMLRYGIHLTESRNGLIKGNFIAGSRRDGIYDNTLLTRTTISANTILNANYRHDVDGHIYDGISVSGDLYYSVISNNLVSSTAPNGEISHRYGYNIQGNLTNSNISSNNAPQSYSGEFNVSGTSNNSFINFTNSGVENEHYIPSIDGNYNNTITHSKNNSNNERVKYSQIITRQMSASPGDEKSDMEFYIRKNGVLVNPFHLTYEGLSGTTSSAWDGSHFVLGNYHLWVDVNGDLRIKNGAPTSDTDGTIVGTQA